VDQKFIFDVSNTIFKVRVTVLQDATLLCFGITHYLCDGSSCFEVVKAFCNILSNKPIPSLVLSPDAEGFCDLASDLPLASSVLFKAKGTLLSSKVISDSTGEESAIYYETQQQNFDTGILKLGRLVWRVVSSKVAAQFGLIDKLTTKFVHLPGTWVNELKARSQEELAVQSLEITLTRNDIIAAWILKVIYSPQPASSAPVDYYGSIDYRQFTDHFEPDTYYIHNEIGLVRCKFSVEQLQKESLANIARDIRLTTLRYKCHESAKQNLRFVEDNINKVLIPSTRAGGNLSFVALSQWTTYDYTSLDFSRASPNGKKPSISFVNPAVSVHMNLILGPIALLAKNGLGDYWVRIGNNSTGWKNFDRSSSMESLFPDQEDCSPT
jgi:hypothetical protein